MKKIAKKILSLAFNRFHRPDSDGFIEVYDDISCRSIYLYWRSDSYIETEIYRHGLYGGWERQSLALWAYLSKISRCVLDVGANTGIYSLISESNSPFAKIIAIEPVDVNFEVLHKNIIKNNFSIITEKVALSNYQGSATMFALKNKINYMTQIDKNRYELHPEIAKNHEIAKIEIEVKSFDYLASKYDIEDIDLIKVDVEGSEFSVLESIFPVLSIGLPSIIVEIISDEGADRINRLFGGLDYHYFSIDEIGRRIIKVDRLWNNDHQNFLICKAEIAEYLKGFDVVIV
ncbi:FkbM family methyltransferase [Methylomonas koyamae]|uniref:FkbM family methyltransferase n=1 Tax=Methylomonas koyamae TaxID=702114 RepID=UPI001642BA98|nr:FkbM family methyltransferase [Methylomonas koyamae]